MKQHAGIAMGEVLEESLLSHRFPSAVPGNLALIGQERTPLRLEDVIQFPNVLGSNNKGLAKESQASVKS
jgi:hypothetical protein